VVSALRNATEHARGVLEGTADSRESTAAADVRSLRAALERLVEAVEELPRSARLNAQADEEFRNLARAARMEVHAARGCLRRLDAFEAALTGLLWPEEGAGR
jgi:hypothetical protein